MTHDLIKNLLESVEAKISRVVVSDLRDNTYYALISMKLNGQSTDIDARPSDAIALALRMNAPIFVSDDVMSKASVDDKETDEEELAAAIPVDALDRLELDMKKAILDERYEDAAKLRDEIQELRHKDDED